MLINLSLLYIGYAQNVLTDPRIITVHTDIQCVTKLSWVENGLTSSSTHYSSFRR